MAIRVRNTIWIERDEDTPVVFWTGFDSGDLPLQVKAANARRIVACVNACKGISTAELEVMPPDMDWFEGITKQRDLLRQQRDQLVEALRSTLARVTHEEIATRSEATKDVMRGIARIVRAALASLKEQEHG